MSKARKKKRAQFHTPEGAIVQPRRRDKCPWCERVLPPEHEPPLTMDPDQHVGRYNGRYSVMNDDQARFYLTLQESLNHYHGFIDLPPKIKWNRWAGMFHLARAHHALHPDRRSNEGWLVVVDMQAEWMMSVPEGFNVPGLPPIEKTRDVMRGLRNRVLGYAKEGRAEFGEIAVKQQQGYILIRHEGEVPTLPEAEELRNKLEHLGSFEL